MSRDALPKTAKPEQGCFRAVDLLDLALPCSSIAFLFSSSSAVKLSSQAASKAGSLLVRGVKVKAGSCTFYYDHGRFPAMR